MEINAFALTDTGTAKNTNEDSYHLDHDLNLYIVADGMGGQAAGDVASATAVKVVTKYVNDRRGTIRAFERSGQDRGSILMILEEAVRLASLTLYEMSRENLSQRGMGTTVSCLLITAQRGFIAHVGDSRIYVVRQSDVIQLTEDHSLVNQLIRQGRMTPDEVKQASYKDAVTRAVGVYADVQVDTLDFELAAGDIFLLCTDGLSGALKDRREVHDLIDARGIKAAPKAFVDLARSRGGEDNITSIVIRVTAQRGEMNAPDSQDISLKLNLLKKMPLFQHLTYVELVEVLNVSDVRSYTTGEHIFKKNDIGEELFVVLDGLVSIADKGLELAKLGTGGHFGEMSIMDKGPRSAEAIAKKSTRLIVVGRRPLFALMRREKEIAVKLLWCFVQVLNQRLRSTNEDLIRARGIDSSMSLPKLNEVD